MNWESKILSWATQRQQQRPATPAAAGGSSAEPVAHASSSSNGGTTSIPKAKSKAKPDTSKSDFVEINVTRKRLIPDRLYPDSRTVCSWTWFFRAGQEHLLLYNSAAGAHRSAMEIQEPLRVESKRLQQAQLQRSEQTYPKPLNDRSNKAGNHKLSIQ